MPIDTSVLNDLSEASPMERLRATYSILADDPLNIPGGDELE